MATDDSGVKARSAFKNLSAGAPTSEERVKQLVESVLTAGPLSDLQITVGELDERVSSLERMEARFREVEAGLEVVDDLREAVRELIPAVFELEKQVDDLEEELQAKKERINTLEQRLATVEGVFDGQLLDGQHAHVQAQEGQPSEIVERGDEVAVTVHDVQFDSPNPQVVGRYQGLVVFVEFSDASADVSEGDVLDIKIMDLQETCATARPLSEVSNDE